MWIQTVISNLSENRVSFSNFKVNVQLVLKKRCRRQVSLKPRYKPLPACREQFVQVSYRHARSVLIFHGSSGLPAQAEKLLRGSIFLLYCHRVVVDL